MSNRVFHPCIVTSSSPQFDAHAQALGFQPHFRFILG
jgi:hypothetical protein